MVPKLFLRHFSQQALNNKRSLLSKNINLLSSKALLKVHRVHENHQNQIPTGIMIRLRLNKIMMENLSGQSANLPSGLSSSLQSKIAEFSNRKTREELDWEKEYRMRFNYSKEARKRQFNVKETIVPEVILDEI